MYLFIVAINLVALAFSHVENSSPVHNSAVLRIQQDVAIWERYTATSEEFSVSMPELPGVITTSTCLDSRCKKKRLENTYAAYSDGGVYIVTSYHNPKQRQSLEEIIAESLASLEKGYEVVSQNDVTRNGFKGKKYVLTSQSGGHARVITFYLTDEHVYEVVAVKEDRNDPSVQKFFESFTLGDKTGKDIGSRGRIEAVSVSATPKGPPEKNTQADQNTEILRSNAVTRKAIVVLKPSPPYTEEARKNLLTGTVVLQMVFSLSGRVEHIRTVSGLPHGLTEQAIRAARKIYFIPAVKDGRRVSTYMRVEYNFNIY